MMHGSEEEGKKRVCKGVTTKKREHNYTTLQERPNFLTSRAESTTTPYGTSSHTEAQQNPLY